MKRFLSVSLVRRCDLQAFWLVGVTLFFGHFPDGLFGQDRSISDAREFESILNGIQDSRARVTSGVCRGTGREVIDSAGGGKLEGEISWFYAFDYLTGQIRSDRQDPVLETDSTSGSSAIKTIGFQYASTPQKTLFIDFILGVKKSPTIFIASPDFVPPRNGEIIDWHTFGLMGWDSVERNISLKNTMLRLKEMSLSGIDDLGDGKRRVKLTPTPIIRYGFIVDTSKGYIVDHFDMWQRSSHDEIGKAPWQLASGGDLSWAQKEGEWVPVKIDLHKGERSLERYSMNIAWESLNKGVPEAFFEPESFEVVPNAMLVDTRFGDK